MTRRLPSETELERVFQNADCDSWAAVDTLADWFSKAFRVDGLFSSVDPPTLKKVSDELGRPDERLQQELVLPVEIVGGFEALWDGQHSDGGNAVLAKCLMARAMGVALAGREPDREFFEKTRMHRPWLPGRDIGHGLFRQLDADGRERWAAVLSPWTGPIGERVFSTTRERSAHLEERAQKWREAPDFKTLLAGVVRAETPDERVLRRLAVLAALSLPHFFEAVRSLPLPDFIWGVVRYTYLYYSWDALLSLVASAPAAFDENGAWAVEQPVVFVVVRAIIERVIEAKRDKANRQRFHAPAMGDTQRETDPFLEVERLTAAFRLLSARKDGRVLAAEVAAHLQRRQYRHRRGEKNPPFHAVCEEEFLELLIEVLDNSTISMQDVFELYRRRVAEVKELGFSEGEMYGSGRVLRSAETFSYLLVAAKMLITSADDSRISRMAEPMWLEYQNAVRDRDRALKSLMINYSDVLTLIDANISPFGHIAAQLDEPVSAWRRTWHLLEPQRFRASFYRHHSELSTLNPSVYHIRVGLDAAYYLARQDRKGAPERAGEMWDAAYTAAIEVWQRLPVMKAFDIEPYVASCLSYLPHILQDEPTVGSLQEYLAPVQYEPRVLVRGVLNLRRNGVGVRALKEALEGMGLEFGLELLRFDWMTSVDVPRAEDFFKLGGELA